MSYATYITNSTLNVFSVTKYTITLERNPLNFVFYPVVSCERLQQINATNLFMFWIVYTDNLAKPFLMFTALHFRATCYSTMVDCYSYIILQIPFLTSFFLYCNLIKSSQMTNKNLKVNHITRVQQKWCSMMRRKNYRMLNSNKRLLWPKKTRWTQIHLAMVSWEMMYNGVVELCRSFSLTWVSL